MVVVCEQEGCPQKGTPVDVGDATRALCGGCQHVAETYAEAPKVTRTRARAREA